MGILENVTRNHRSFFGSDRKKLVNHRDKRPVVPTSDLVDHGPGHRTCDYGELRVVISTSQLETGHIIHRDEPDPSPRRPLSR